MNRQLDFVFLSIKRVIMHKINHLSDASRHATVEYSDRLLSINDDAKKTIKTRLKEAFNKESKSFIMMIKDFRAESFPQICSELLAIYPAASPDELFIQKSHSIVNLLADQHDRRSIPPGFLLVIEAIDTHNGFPCIIVIKADPHDAVSVTGNDAKALEVILSPSQKLFKVGIIFKIGSGAEINNVNFGAQIFDDQFSNTNPAKYFYEDFLNFSINQNDKYNTSVFFEKVQNFIISNYPDIRERERLIFALRAHLFTSSYSHISPFEFSEQFISDEDKKVIFHTEIINQMPGTFVKDLGLLKSQLKSQSIWFDSGVKINIPTNEENGGTVMYEILHDQPDPMYTLIKLQGKPYSVKRQ